jgi:predicted dehydrogenase
MGRLGCARNFVLALEGKAAPLNTPDQAVKLMRIVDAIYASAARGEPIKLS